MAELVVYLFDDQLRSLLSREMHQLVTRHSGGVGGRLHVTPPLLVGHVLHLGEEPGLTLSLLG